MDVQSHSEVIKIGLVLKSANCKYQLTTLECDTTIRIQSP